MSPDPPGAIPPPASPEPDAKLSRNVRELCLRIVRGKTAAQNWSVRGQLVLRVASILLSSLGGVGVIADKAAGNLPGQTGWAFWGSVVLLAFGILSQVANELRVAQRAADSRSLAERCELYETRLDNMLLEDDPRTAVAALLLEANTLFESERYNAVLPQMTDERQRVADQRAGLLIARHRNYWQLRERKQKGVIGPRKAPPAAPPPATPEPPVGPSGDKTHEP